MAYQDRGNNEPRKQMVVRAESQVSAIVTRAQSEFSVIAASDKLVEWAREAAYARQLIVNDEFLIKADERSIVNAVVNIANVGLTLSPIHQFCTLIARWDKKAGAYIASLMVMYKGLMKLATDIGLDDLTIENVYEKDDFDYWTDDEGNHATYKKNIRGGKKDTEENPYVGTFVRAKFKAYSGVFTEFVDAEDMELIRSQSDAYDPEKPWCVWIKWAGEQRKKAALKRAQKRWPKTTSKEWERFEKAIAIDNEVEGAKLKERAERDKNAVDAETTDVATFTKEQTEEVLKLCRESGVSPFRLGLAYQVDVKNDGAGLEGMAGDKFNEIKERLVFAIAEKKKRAGGDEEGAETP